MQQSDKFRDYAALVCGQLRWKKARPVIAREIETHLQDQCDALVRGGMGEEEAIDESIRQMGDAVEIGTSLDRVHRPKPSWGLLVLTGILLLAGLGIHIFITCDSVFSGRLLFHLIAALLGFGCLIGAYFMDYTILGKWPLAFFAGAIALISCVILFDPAGARGRSYIAAQLTLLLPLAYAALLYGLRGKRYLGLAFALVGLAVPCVFCAIIPCVAGLLITAAAWGDWFKIGKGRGLILLGALVLVGAATVFLYIWSSAYLRERMELAFHPELDPTGRGWTGMLIREVLAGARLVGKGTLEAYEAVTPFLLESTDFLLTYLIHRVGWISLIVLLAVFLVFFAAAVHKCLKQKNMLGRLASLSVILTLALQVLLYVCLNLGICLFGGISLPLISYANTALVVNMALIGVMLSAFRTGLLVRDGEQPWAKRSRWADRVRWKDGELTISFRRTLPS
ncbi:MAG: permease prefix domain 1-containing protein [Oscillospiraceae bacterium]